MVVYPVSYTRQFHSLDIHRYIAYQAFYRFYRVYHIVLRKDILFCMLYDEYRADLYILHQDVLSYVHVIGLLLRQWMDFYR